MEYCLATKNGHFMNTDGVYPLLTLHYFGKIGVIAFFIGVVASTFASMDSCIAALTTAFSYDFLDIENKPPDFKKKLKNLVLLGVNGSHVFHRHVILEQPGCHHQYDFQNSRLYLRADFGSIPDRIIFQNTIPGRNGFLWPCVSGGRTHLAIE